LTIDLANCYKDKLKKQTEFYNFPINLKEVFMKLVVFVNEYKEPPILDRLKADRFGIVFVQNGVYHTTLKKDGNQSPLLSKDAELYALSEDLESRGFKAEDVDSKVKVINYEGLVDLIFNDYEKIIWL